MPAQSKTLKINLLPREDFEYTFPGLFLKWALSYGRYIIIITQIIVLSVFFLRFKLDREHVDLKESISEKQALFSSVSDVENEIRNIQNHLLNIKKLEEGQYNSLQVLNFLQDNTPIDVTYNGLKISDTDLVLNGKGNNLRSLSSLLLQLKRSNKFSEITLDDIKRQLDGSITFKIGTKFLADSFKI